jgi:hypothetical protein
MRKSLSGNVLMLALCLFGFGCSEESGEAENGSVSSDGGIAVFDESAAIARGQSILAPFKKNLQAALMDGMGQGPEHAIQVCQLKAPAIASEISTDSFQVGRTSHRLRNLSNTPASWMQPLLDRAVASGTNAVPMAVSLPDGGAGYVEPIFIKPLCLGCHGSEVPESIVARLDELYPADNARGFSEGEFRGLFWVKFESAPMAE